MIVPAAKIRAVLDAIKADLVEGCRQLTPAQREVWIGELQQAIDLADDEHWQALPDIDYVTRLNTCAICRHPQVWTNVHDWGHCCSSCEMGG